MALLQPRVQYIVLAPPFVQALNNPQRCGDPANCLHQHAAKSKSGLQIIGCDCTGGQEVKDGGRLLDGGVDQLWIVRHSRVRGKSKLYIRGGRTGDRRIVN